MDSDHLIGQSCAGKSKLNIVHAVFKRYISYPLTSAEIVPIEVHGVFRTAVKGYILDITRHFYRVLVFVLLFEVLHLLSVSVLIELISYPVHDRSVRSKRPC